MRMKWKNLQAESHYLPTMMYFLNLPNSTFCWKTTFNMWQSLHSVGRQHWTCDIFWRQNQWRVETFCQNYCGEVDPFPEILAEVRKFEVNKISKKISKLTFQIMGFVYTRMMDFLIEKFWFFNFSFILAKFFERLHHLLPLSCVCIILM